MAIIYKSIHKGNTLFHIIVHSPRVQVSVAISQWYDALHKLEHTMSLLNDPVELRKLIPSATNIYNKASLVSQRYDIIEAQRDLILKINILENSNV